MSEPFEYPSPEFAANAILSRHTDGYFYDTSTAERQKADKAWRKAVVNWGRFYKADILDLRQPADIVDSLRENWFEGGWTPEKIITSWYPSATLLFGSVGSGKSWLAFALAKEAIYCGVASSFKAVNAYEMYQRLKFGGGETIEDYVRPHLLLIDDIGSEDPPPWSAEQLFAVVDGRWRREDPTIITTNLDLPGFRRHVGEQVFSRLGDHALAIQLGGTDRRINDLPPSGGCPLLAEEYQLAKAA